MREREVLSGPVAVAGAGADWLFVEVGPDRLGAGVVICGMLEESGPANTGCVSLFFR